MRLTAKFGPIFSALASAPKGETACGESQAATYDRTRRQIGRDEPGARGDDVVSAEHDIGNSSFLKILLAQIACGVREE
ncbi:MAG: hypothetical protein HKN14_06670 [Marinicaulis sp.]|nr:hypothetical protein [Marinicaulis sp.]